MITQCSNCPARYNNETVDHCPLCMENKFIKPKPAVNSPQVQKYYQRKNMANQKSYDQEKKDQS